MLHFSQANKSIKVAYRSWFRIMIAIKGIADIGNIPNWVRIITTYIMFNNKFSSFRVNLEPVCLFLCSPKTDGKSITNKFSKIYRMFEKVKPLDYKLLSHFLYLS